MKCSIAAFALFSAIGSYAAEMSEPGIAIYGMIVRIAKDTLKINEFSLYVAIYDQKDLEDGSLYKAIIEQRLSFDCSPKFEGLRQFPDVLDCRAVPDDQAPSTFRFSIHAPIPQISPPADRSQLTESRFVPEWTNPLKLYMEWDTANSRTFGSYEVPAGQLKTLWSDTGGIYFTPDLDQKYIQVDVINQPKLKV